MVQIIPNGKSVSLESTIKITEGMANVVKSRKEEMDKMAKEVNIEYFLATDENGTHTLRIVSNNHKKLLADEIEKFKELETHLVQSIEDLVNAPNKKDLPQSDILTRLEEHKDIADKVHKLIGDDTPYILIYVNKDGSSQSGTMPPQIAFELILERLVNS